MTINYIYHVTCWVLVQKVTVACNIQHNLPQHGCTWVAPIREWPLMTFLLQYGQIQILQVALVPLANKNNITLQVFMISNTLFRLWTDNTSSSIGWGRFSTQCTLIMNIHIMNLKVSSKKPIQLGWINKHSAHLWAPEPRQGRMYKPNNAYINSRSYNKNFKCHMNEA
jgi:hypothetical protein